MSSIPNVENELSQASSEMKIPSQYDNVDWGARTKLVNRKVSTKSSKTGEIFGSKTIMTKEHAKPTFIEHLINESDDITLLPDRVIGEIKSNIRKGAKDLAQNWKNALELVHKAYQVSNVRRPTPDQKGAWKQYEQLIQVAVRQLVATRGIDGKWRTSNVLVREATDKGIDSGKRFFVEIPGESSKEVAGKSLDDIIEAIQNKILRSREVTGTKVRVEERSKTHAVLTIWVHGVKRERIVVKEIS